MYTPVVVIGAGPGGLAMSYHLTRSGVEHVVLERGQVANSWRHERWDSLRLLTPNWMTALPGCSYSGEDPHGFMTAAETTELLDSYRHLIGAPVHEEIAVESVRLADGGYVVSSRGAQWRCEAVVVATGGSSEARVPAFAPEFPRHVEQFTAVEYRRPDQLPAGGGVLVVGASASGVQIADELQAHGREVTVSVGEHVRLPRSYRGVDIYDWLGRIGQLDERFDEVEDLERARRHASVQLVGTPEHRDLDINTLRDRGVRVVGRLMSLEGTKGLCSGGLTNLAKNADLKQTRLLRRIDDYVTIQGLGDQVGPPSAPEPTTVGDPPTELDLTKFAAVVWATGYRPRYPWLTPEALDRRGRIAHDGGVGALPGLYVLGLPFLRRRRSNIISGLGADAAELSVLVRSHLDRRARDRMTALSV